MKLPGPIIILDDDLDDHDILKSICENIGVCSDLHFFDQPGDLITYLKSSKQNPFIILCDINMPVSSGLDVREIINRDPLLKRKCIPFVFFTTGASQKIIEQAFDLCVQGFFLKGQSMAESERKLRLILEYWMESKRPN